ncbi:MAG: hypothetical protein KTR29_10110 [Rhodothermaceae bacterium]|nr:hypothetical protein [Rhodothermaceae bacterium]
MRPEVAFWRPRDPDSVRVLLDLRPSFVLGRISRVCVEDELRPDVALEDRLSPRCTVRPEELRPEELRSDVALDERLSPRCVVRPDEVRPEAFLSADRALPRVPRVEGVEDPLFERVAELDLDPEEPAEGVVDRPEVPLFERLVAFVERLDEDLEARSVA